jgi:signal transduction histidine kinase
MDQTLTDEIVQLAAAAVDDEALARAALERIVPAFGADAGEITLSASHGIAPRLARVGDPSRALARSVITAPLAARGAVVADIAVWSMRESAFAAEEAPRLRTVAAPLGPALAMLRTADSDDAARLGIELRALHRLAETGARALDLDEVLGSSLDLALDVMGASMGMILLREEARSTYRAVLVRNVPRDAYLEEFPCAVVDPFFERLEYLERTMQQLLQLGINRAVIERGIEHGMARVVMLPLRREQRIVGILSLPLRASEQFEPTTLHTLRAITGHVAVFLENARVHRLVARRERLASLLREFAEKVVSPIEPSELYRLVLPTLCEITRCNGALISRINAETGLARIIAGLGRDEVLVGFEMPLKGAHVVEHAAVTTGVLVVEDTSQIPVETVVGRVARERGTKSFVLLAMRHRGQPIGHLFAGSDESRRWEHEELEAVELLGTMTAEVLERERLAALADAERRVLDATIEDLPIVISVVDHQGRVLHINRAARKFASLYPRSQKRDWRETALQAELRLPDGTVVPQSDWPLLRAFRGETVLPTEYMMPIPGQPTANVLVFAVPISRDTNGQVTAVATGYQDVSALRALADEKDRFLRVASHELRSPLTSLRATTSLLELDPSAVSDPERRATMLQRIRRQIDRLVKLVEQLIDSARVRAELPLEPKECDLVEIAREAIDLAVTANGDPQRRVVLHAPPTLVGAWDPLRIEQAVTNLVANALRYSPTESEVDVTLEATGDDRVRVSVVDRGIGIPTDQIDSVFGPFFRAKNAVAAHRGGLGLGLYITAEIVRRHHGTISVESEPNVRTAFVIDLPRRVN